jgi:hypothetical protein
VRQQSRVFIIIAIRIGLAIDQIVETLKPHKTGKFIASLGSYAGQTRGICQHFFHMLNHHAIKHTRGGILVFLPFLSVLEFGNAVGTLRMFVPLLLNLLGQLVWPGTGGRNSVLSDLPPQAVLMIRMGSFSSFSI